MAAGRSVMEGRKGKERKGGRLRRGSGGASHSHLLMRKQHCEEGRTQGGSTRLKGPLRERRRNSRTYPIHMCVYSYSYYIYIRICLEPLS